VNADAIWQSSEDLKGRPRDEVLSAQLSEATKKVPLKEIQMVGHRVVHGGRKFRRSTLITEEVIEEIDRLCQLAPLHNPAGLSGINLARKLLPHAKQVAVFDTALYALLPPDCSVYALPYSFYEEHEIQRYGFHGINHGYVAERAAQMLGVDNLRVVSCHLGNGCSVTGLINNRSVYTSMGYTPLEGLVMGTRCGSIDPGIIVHVLSSGLVKQSDLDDLLNKKSGLLGISGKTNDMKELLGLSVQGDERSKLAVDVFVQRLRCEIGAAIATMDGTDAIIFTGGIGENAVAIREQACSRLSFIDVQLDRHANAQARGDAIISTAASRLKLLVVTARENLAIASQCLKLADFI
jgi:acetate kinase